MVAKSISKMDLDDDHAIMSQSDESDVEYDLEQLKELDNEKQLNILKREIGHIVAHGLFPSEGWYDERFEYINLYSQLGWSHLAQKFHNKDQYIHDTAIYIMHLSDELLEERGSKPNFNIRTYYSLINNIHSLWNYYKQVYCEEDDMMDLISGMSGLMK